MQTVADWLGACRFKGFPWCQLTAHSSVHVLRQFPIEDRQCLHAGYLTSFVAGSFALLFCVKDAASCHWEQPTLEEPTCPDFGYVRLITFVTDLLSC